jgi:hypothetical protein
MCYPVGLGLRRDATAPSGANGAVSRVVCAPQDSPRFEGGDGSFSPGLPGLGAAPSLQLSPIETPEADYSGRASGQRSNTEPVIRPQARLVAQSVACAETPNLTFPL